MKSDLDMIIAAHEDEDVIKMPEKQEGDLTEAELLYYELIRAIEEEEEVRFALPNQISECYLYVFKFVDPSDFRVEWYFYFNSCIQTFLL